MKCSHCSAEIAAKLRNESNEISKLGIQSSFAFKHQAISSKSDVENQLDSRHAYLKSRGLSDHFSMITVSLTLTG